MAAIWLTIQAQAHKYEHSMAVIWLMMQTQVHKYEHSMAAIFDSFELTPKLNGLLFMNLEQTGG
jgi:hypothetical protein